MEKNRTTKRVGEVAAERPSSTGRASTLKKWFFSLESALREFRDEGGARVFKEILEKDREESVRPEEPTPPGAQCVPSRSR